jgi:hypothetical protein
MSLIVAAMVMVTVTACGGDRPAGPGLGNLTATIDGDDWVASVGATATRNNDVVAIGAGDASGRAIGIGFVDIGIGSYPMTGATPSSAVLTEDGRRWSATVVGGGGMLTITALDGSHVAGSFSFTAVPNAASGATGNRVVTSGAFDVEFQAAP